MIKFSRWLFSFGILAEFGGHTARMGKYGIMRAMNHRRGRFKDWMALVAARNMAVLPCRPPSCANAPPDMSSASVLFRMRKILLLS